MIMRSKYVNGWGIGIRKVPDAYLKMVKYDRKHKCWFGFHKNFPRIRVSALSEEECARELFEEIEAQIKLEKDMLKNPPAMSGWIGTVSQGTYPASQ